jgi:HSP20 family protein
VLLTKRPAATPFRKKRGEKAMAIIHRSDVREDRERYSGAGRGSGRWATVPFYESPESVEEEGCWSPNVDIQRRNDSIRLYVELPGMSKDDVTIKLETGILTISGERRPPSEEERAKYVRMERCYGGFCRSFSMNDQIDQDRIAARMDNGILTIELPLKAENRAKQIEISAS